MNYVIVILAVVVGCGACGSGKDPLRPGPASHESPTTLSGSLTNAPTIDGAVLRDEWAGALLVSSFPGATLLVGTHRESLYLSLKLIDDESHWEDARWEIRFDNDRDGTRDEAENHLVLTGSDYEDRPASASSWGFLDSQTDGMGEAAGLLDFVFLEIGLPLKSGDPKDFSLSRGDRVGYCIGYSNKGSGYPLVTYPDFCMEAERDLSEYAELPIQ